MTKKINQNSWTMRMTFFCRTLTEHADITNASISLPDNCPAISTNAPKPVPCCWLLSMKSLSISSRHWLCYESYIIWLPPSPGPSQDPSLTKGQPWSWSFERGLAHLRALISWVHRQIRFLDQLRPWLHEPWHDACYMSERKWCPELAPPMNINEHAIFRKDEYSRDGMEGAVSK